MKLTSCPRCERHVLVEAASCPFCGTRLGTTSALGRAMMIAVVSLSGLSMSCGGDDSTETSVASDPTQGVTSQGESTSINNETDAGGADYAGPETSLSAGPETTTGDTTTTSGSTSDTDTDAGSTTGTPATDSGGADYAGPGTTSG